MQSRRIAPLGLTLSLGSLVTLAAFATDMGLPVLADTARSLGVEPGTAALTMSVFMVGFGLGPLVAGPISDHHGRRPILITGTAMFAVFGALAAFSTSFGALLLWRFLMGAGAGACQTIVVAMIRDLFVGHEARVQQSHVNMAAGVAPIIAPSIGVAIAAVFGGWRAIYAALALGGVALCYVAWFRLRESAPRRAGSVLTVSGALRSYGRVLAHPVSIGYALVIALNFGSLFAYVSGSSLVLMELLGVSPRVYGALFAVTSLGLMAGSFLSAGLNRRRVPHARIIGGGFITVVGTSVLLLVLTLAKLLTVASLVPIAIVGMIGQGVIRPNASQGALEPMADIAGIASAVVSTLAMVAGATASAVVAALFDGRSALAVTGTMAACAVLSAVVYRRLVRPREKAAVRAVPPEPELEPPTRAAA